MTPEPISRKVRTAWQVRSAARTRRLVNMPEPDDPRCDSALQEENPGQSDRGFACVPALPHHDLPSHGLLGHALPIAKLS
jgi:hypothetical protein